jgi:hypothetical protein
MSAMKTKTAGSGGKGMPTAEPAPIVLTIGHSTRTLAEFIRLLQEHAVSCVVDVRTVPRSRHNPQFNKVSLPRALKKASLGYVHLPGLDGLRHTSVIRTTGLAKYFLSGLCGLHANARIRAEPQGIGGERGPALLWRRSGAVALSSFALADALLVQGIRRGI